MTTEVTPPKWALEKDLSTLKDRTLALVQSTKEKSGPALSRIVAGIGEASQKKMSSANDLMAGSVGTLLKGLDGKSPTGEKLLELRSAMDDLNPHSLSNSWWFAWMPKGVKRKAISRFINRYQPMQAHLNGIFDGLRNGKDELLETSIALEEQYDEIAAAKKEMEAEIYVGELFIKQVEELEAVVDTDPRELQKLGAVKNQAMRRIRDIRTMEQAAVQFFISIDQTVATNSLLGEQIDSALVVGPMVMSNALRIQAALAQQDSVREAVESVQNAMGDMMAQNAAAVNQAAQKVGDMYNNPVIGLEKLEEGFDQLMQAVNTANATIATSTIKARETSDRLAQMTAELEPVAAGMRDARAEGAAQEPVLSLENGKSEAAVRGSND
jgi:uncharacterized protein YaaN involved in tellurite resistance